MPWRGLPRPPAEPVVKPAAVIITVNECFTEGSGERQLVSILSAWAMDTDILLLDEPTANLDYAAIKELGDLLGKLKACGKTMVISEHRLYYLSGIADEYWLMEDGQIRKRCTEEEIKDLQKESGIPLRTLALEDVVNRLKFKLVGFLKSDQQTV